MSESSSRPLLTFAIAAYNHARFAREAVEAAFAQTYSPLEIVLSDDCSNDGTFEIMRDIAKTYRGPHRIVLNQNPANAGLSGHCNRIAELSKGELIIMAAADDISLPNRVEASWQAWEATDRKAGGVHARVINIDENGRRRGNSPAPSANGSPVAFRPEGARAVLKEYLRTGSPVILGCTTAWNRAVFKHFGPLPTEVVYEDMALGFRARLLGGMVFVDSELVLYRLHGSNLHHAGSGRATTLRDLLAEEERNKVSLERHLVAARAFRADLERARQARLINESERAELLAEIEQFEQAHALELDFTNAPLFRRLALFPRLARSRRERNGHPAKLARCLPRWSYYAMRLLKARLIRTAHSEN